MVGVFAGRGDVIISMGLACAAGVFAGWWLRAQWGRLQAWRQSRKK
jgi:hypothetical protein